MKLNRLCNKLWKGWPEGLKYDIVILEFEKSYIRVSVFDRNIVIHFFWQCVRISEKYKTRRVGRNFSCNIIGLEVTVGRADVIGPIGEMNRVRRVGNEALKPGSIQFARSVPATRNCFDSVGTSLQTP